MNRHLQSILFIAGLVLCTSFAMIMSPLEMVDQVSVEDKPNVTENQIDTATDNSKSEENLERIVNEPYDLPTNMYIVKRGGTDRLHAASGSSDTIADIAKTVGTTTTAEDVPKKEAPSPTKTSPAKAKSEDELDLLARLITAEAQGEPYETKVAVGAVVMNRVKSSQFPNTIKEVIYHNIDGYIQFTPVANGWIKKPAQADCIKAAKEAINGADPTNGALFFYSNKSTNAYMLEKKISLKSGNMNFTY